MKKQSIFLIFILSLTMLWLSCGKWSTSIDPLIDRVEDVRLTSENQIPFVINGVKTRFATTHDVLMLLCCLLSDEMFFDSNVPNATYPTFADIDVGHITTDNNSVDGAYNALGELRFFADDLVRRVGEVGGFSDANLKNEALFWGKFFGGVARYFYATYFGLTETQGGGIIDNGPFISSADMYNLALEKFTEALTYTDDAYLTRVVNSIIARIYLFEGDYTKAAQFADKGMVEGDDPFQSLHSIDEDNYFWQQAGPGRTQAVVDWRFKDYVVADPNELSRVPLDSIKGNNDVWYYRQGKYLNEKAPINFISWQDNNLMLAECALNGAGTGDALALINAVRASHGIDPLTTVDMSVLKTERDKEICWTGIRLPDERRWSDWHLAAGTWEYLPITERERNINPNID